MLLLFFPLAAALGLRGAAAGQAQTAATARGGLDEVISLLQGMLQKFAAHFNEDRTNWESYSALADEQETDKQAFLTDQKSLLSSTTALLNAKRDEVAKLTTDLQTLATDIAQTQSSLKELADLRAKEHEQHEAELADLLKSIAAVTKATEVLAGQYAATPENVALIRRTVQMGITSLQVSGRQVQGLPSGTTEFLQGANPDWLKKDGSAYETYNTQGGGTTVLNMLENLRLQLEETKTQSISKETESRQQYEETRLAKEEELQRSQMEQKEKAARKLEAEATVEECVATIDQANTAVQEAEEFLRTLAADRQKFQAEFDDRNKLRQAERAATQAALDALQQVSAGNSVAFLQVSAVNSVAFLQVRARDSGFVRADSGFREIAASSAALPVPVSPEAAIAHLSGSFDIESPQIAMITAAIKNTAVASQEPGYMDQTQTQRFSGDSMQPVKNLLHELIRKLEEEASAESSHHDWCETEKETSTSSQKDREHQIHTMKERIAGDTTTVSTLKSSILFLQDELARIAKETDEAVQLRKQEHEAFLKAKADHDEVISALERAVTALSNQFAFLQTQGAQSPFAEYDSTGAGSASVIEMLQDLLNRYSQARQSVVKGEEDAVKAHEELLATNEAFRVDTTNLKNSKTSNRRALLGELTANKEAMKTSLLELQQVNQYLQDLRPSCDDIRSTFEERKKRREAEIAALKEALSVISDPSASAAP
jgi:DNA repair exonuclease SbcCD ATPase subunit